MSIRSYTYYEPAESRRRPGVVAARIPWMFAGATVLAQIAYPLIDGDARNLLTVVTVVLFFLASATHALVWRGAAWAAGFVVVSVGVGLVVEAIGSSTGYPFGTYVYADSLGSKLFGVPWVIPLAWSMMAYPALIAARRLVRGRWTTPLVGAVALASWDLFLDPQMVDAGHWSFTYPTPSVVFEPGIPWTNLGGWFVVSLGLMAVLDRLPRRGADDRQPAALYLWTYFSFVLANLVFFDEPRVALAGGVMMGLVALPYAWLLWSERA